MEGREAGGPRVTVAGGISIVDGDRLLHEHELPGRQGRLAFACLVLERDRPLPRDELAELLWPDRLPAAWEKSIAVVVSKLRSALQRVGWSEPDVLTSAFGCYRLNLPAGTVIDVVGAADDVDTAERLLREGDAHGALDAATAAAEVASRPLLVGEEGDWVDRRRAELKGTLIRALDVMVDAALGIRDFRRAVRGAEDVVALEPFRETGYALLMRAHMAAGDRAEALRVHERCRVLLAEELGVDPSPELEQLYVEILRADRVAQPVPDEERESHRPVAPSQTHGLPLVASSFIGRQDEIDRLEARLTSGTRLLTLTGLGGVGKTRLALEVARRAAPAFADGVCFVDLAPLRDATMVVPVLASAIGGIDPLTQATAIDLAAAGRALEAHLVGSLQSQRRLVVLDNCEHLADECARLCTLLVQSCHDVAILATSRELLGVPGEQASVVLPLSSSGDEREPDGASDAVLLFLERARAIRPDLDLDAGDVVAVTEICRRLDGIPLAIELAAARLRVLTPAQIAERLGDVLHLLGAPVRGVAERHRTLQAAMEWSFGLLAEKEAAVLRRLSVFAGSCTLGAAEDVCAFGPVERDEVLDVIQRLVEKSLVSSQDHRGRSRYRLHEIVRQFAYDKLDASKEIDLARNRHADWFVAEAGQISSYLDVEVDRFAEFEPDAENFRAAFRWLLDSGNARDALKMAVSLHGFWRSKNLIAVTVEQIEEALAAFDKARPSRSWASALGLAAGIAIDHGDLDRALALAEEALEVAQAAGNEVNIGWMYLAVARATILRGDTDEAEAAIDRGVELLRGADEPIGLSWALTLRARLVLGRGDDDGVGQVCEEILTIGERGSAQARAEAQVLTGLCASLRGDHERGRTLCDEALAAARSAMPYNLQYLLLQASVIDIAVEHDLGRARARLREVFELAREVRAVQFLPNSLSAAAVVAGDDGCAQAVAQLVGAADRLREETGVRMAFRRLTPILECTIELARKTLGEDDFEREYAAGRDTGLAGAVDLALDVLRRQP